MFKWNEKYSVNVEQINNQHKKLFELGNKIYNILSLNDDYDHYDEIMNALYELKDYTVYHFGYEESIMNKYKYASSEVHKIEHNMFVNKIEEFLKKDIDLNQKEVLMDMLKFILTWIENHILKSDMKYKIYFNSQGLY